MDRQSDFSYVYMLFLNRLFLPCSLSTENVILPIKGGALIRGALSRGGVYLILARLSQCVWTTTPRGTVDQELKL